MHHAGFIKVQKTSGIQMGEKSNVDEVENLSLRKDELFKGGAPIGE